MYCSVLTHEHLDSFNYRSTRYKMDVPVAAPTMPLRPRCQDLSDPSARPPAPLAAPPSRATELLTAAAAHRTYVEQCLAGDQHRIDQHQTGQRLAEMMEGWMTGEDAIEVAVWHVDSGHMQSGTSMRERRGLVRPLDPVPRSDKPRPRARHEA